MKPPEKAWSSFELRDLSRSVDCERWKKTQWLTKHRARLSGLVPRLSDGKPALIFFVDLEGTGWGPRAHWSGTAKVRAGDRRFDYEITPDLVKIRVDGRRLASLDAHGTVRDRDGEAIGSFVRPDPPALTYFRVTVGPFAYVQHRDSRPADYPITLYGHPVAHVALMKFATRGPGYRQDPGPAIRLVGLPKARERRLILALAAWELTIKGPLEAAEQWTPPDD